MFVVEWHRVVRQNAFAQRRNEGCLAVHSIYAFEAGVYYVTKINVYFHCTGGISAYGGSPVEIGSTFQTSQVETEM